MTECAVMISHSTGNYWKWKYRIVRSNTHQAYLLIELYLLLLPRLGAMVFIVLDIRLNQDGGGSNRRNSLHSKPSVNETIQMNVYDALMLTGMVAGLSYISCHVAWISSWCNIILKLFPIKHTVVYWYQYGTIHPVYLSTIYTNHHLKLITRNTNYICIVSWTASN